MKKAEKEFLELLHKALESSRPYYSEPTNNGFTASKESLWNDIPIPGWKGCEFLKYRLDFEKSAVLVSVFEDSEFDLGEIKIGLEDCKTGQQAFFLLHRDSSQEKQLFEKFHDLCQNSLVYQNKEVGEGSYSPEARRREQIRKTMTPMLLGKFSREEEPRYNGQRSGSPWPHPEILGRIKKNGDIGEHQ